VRCILPRGAFDYSFLPSETRPLLPKPTQFDAQASTKSVGNSQVALSYPSNPWETTRTPLQTMGWRHITLPDNSVYFYHPTLRVTTDIDLRLPSKLDAVTSYLQENSIDESFLPPEGWESWLVDSNVGKKHNPKPISSWVNHAGKILSFASPSLPQSHEVGTARMLDDDRMLISCFVCTAGCSIQPRSRPRIPLLGFHGITPRPCISSAQCAFRCPGCIDLVVYRSVLFTSSPHYKATQLFSDCLLPSARPAPPPFSQEECQELIKLLETLGKVITLGVLPTLTPT